MAWAGGRKDAVVVVMVMDVQRGTRRRGQESFVVVVGGGDGIGVGVGVVFAIP